MEPDRETRYPVSFCRPEERSVRGGEAVRKQVGLQRPKSLLKRRDLAASNIDPVGENAYHEIVEGAG